MYTLELKSIKTKHDFIEFKSLIKHNIYIYIQSHRTRQEISSDDRIFLRVLNRFIYRKRVCRAFIEIHRRIRMLIILIYINVAWYAN